MERRRYSLDDILLKAGIIRGLMLKTFKHKYHLNPTELELLFILYDMGYFRRSKIKTSEILEVYSGHRNSFFSSLNTLKRKHLLLIPERGHYLLTDKGKLLIYDCRRDLETEMARYS